MTLMGGCHVTQTLSDLEHFAEADTLELDATQFGLLRRSHSRFRVNFCQRYICMIQCFNLICFLTEKDAHISGRCIKVDLAFQSRIVCGLRHDHVNCR